MESQKINNNPQVLNNFISVRGAADFSGYSTQYLRRLLRNTKLKGTKIGQLWLVDKGSLDTYIQKAQQVTDQRYGPR